jgi:hypothetical protein
MMDESPPAAAVLNSAWDLDQQARLMVEGRKIGPDRLDPEAVASAHWQHSMEAHHNEATAVAP